MLSPEELNDLRRLAPAPGTNNSKFAPKLTVHQRHQAYALMRLGYSQGVVAKTFGVNRATMGHMNRETSAFYKDVRDNWKSMGEELFLAKYVDRPTVERANEYMAMMKADDVPMSGQHRPNALADKKAGWHDIGSHRFYIHFMNRPDLGFVGWTVDDKDANTENPATIDSSIMEPTSGAAYKKVVVKEREGTLY